MNEFRYTSAKTAHHQAFAPFVDQAAPEFEHSDLFRKLIDTKYIRVDDNGNNLESAELNTAYGHYLFNILRGDYDYLVRWYHNEHRKSNTRHGTYIMLYDSPDGYQWKLGEWFFTRILTGWDLTELFDFG